MKRLTLQGGVRFDNGITNYTSDPIGGLPDYPLMPTQVSFPHRVDPGDRLEGHHPASGRGLRSVRERQDRRQSERRQIHGRSQFVVRAGHEPDLPHSHHDDTAVAESHQFQFHQQPGLQSREPRGAARLRAGGQSNLRDSGLQHQLRPQHGHRLGKPPVRLVDGRVGAAGAPVRCGVDRRLLPQLVGQPVHGGQHPHEPRPTTRRTASTPRSIRGCQGAEGRRSAASSI